MELYQPRHLLPLGALVASQKCRRVGARSSPRPDGVWGEKNAPVVSYHGYVRALFTRPGRPLCVGCRLGICLDGGGVGTKVHANLVRMAGAKLVGWSSLACPRGGISGAPRGGVQLLLTPCVGRRTNS